MPSLKSVSRKSGSRSKRCNGTSLRSLPLFGRIVENRYPLFYFGDRISTEAREACDYTHMKFLRCDIGMKRLSPFLGRGIKKLQTHTIEPEDSRLFRGRLHFWAEIHEPIG